MTPTPGDSEQQGTPDFDLPQMPRHEARPPVDTTAAPRSYAGDSDEIVVDRRAPASRTRLWITGGIAAVVIVLLVVGLLVWGPGSPLTNDPPPSSPAASTEASGPLAAPVLPARFTTYTRANPQSSIPPDPTDDDLFASTAVYTQNGESSILLIAATPVTSMEQFLLSLGAAGPREEGPGWCATYQEVPLCGIVKDGVAWAVSPLAGQSPAALISIAEDAAAAE